MKNSKVVFLFVSIFPIFMVSNLATANTQEIWGGTCQARECTIRVRHVTGQSTRNGEIRTKGWVLEGCKIVKIKGDAGEVTSSICASGGEQWTRSSGTGASITSSVLRTVAYDRGCNAKIWVVAQGLKTKSKVYCPEPDPNTGEPVKGNWQ